MMYTHSSSPLKAKWRRRRWLWRRRECCIDRMDGNFRIKITFVDSGVFVRVEQFALCARDIERRRNQCIIYVQMRQQQHQQQQQIDTDTEPCMQIKMCSDLLVRYFHIDSRHTHTQMIPFRFAWVAVKVTKREMKFSNSLCRPPTCKVAVCVLSTRRYGVGGLVVTMLRGSMELENEEEEEEGVK